MPKSAPALSRFALLAPALLLVSAAVSPLLADPSTPPSGAAQTPPPADAAKNYAAGKDLFANWSCGSCHSLADAGADGHVGPAFDGNSGLTEAFIVNRVTNGQGAMPSFGGQMTDAEIAQIAAYIAHARKQ